MPKDRSEYLNPYRDAVREHGPGFEATLWGSRDAQRLRFDVMIDLVDLDGRVVLDVGCGQGDFAVHLHERSVPFLRYVGIDAMPAMVEHARGRGQDRCEFLTADVVCDPAPIASADADFVFISGTLNTMDDRTARTVVRAAFQAASAGVVFNFLSDRPHARWRERDLTPARRFDTVAWVDWALGLSSRVVFTQAYLDGHDATVAVWKDDA